MDGFVGVQMRDKIFDCAVTALRFVHGFARDDNNRRGGVENGVEDWDQDQKEDDLIELRGVTGDAVAEVDGPREIGGRAVGVVGEAGEETSNASDGDAEGEGDGVKISGGCVESDVTFGEFDGDEAEGESRRWFCLPGRDRLGCSDVAGLGCGSSSQKRSLEPSAAPATAAATTAQRRGG